MDEKKKINRINIIFLFVVGIVIFFFLFCDLGFCLLYWCLNLNILCIFCIFGFLGCGFWCVKCDFWGGDFDEGLIFFGEELGNNCLLILLLLIILGGRFGVIFFIKEDFV